MEFHALKSVIIDALMLLYEKDSLLINCKMEWSSAHRLAVYLEKSLGTIWNIDCEYNKMSADMVTKHNSEGKYKRPDIIIHKRGEISKEQNLLVIEIKMNNSSVADTNKLKSFTSESNQTQLFQYQYGLSLVLLPGSTHLEWYSNGTQISSDCQQYS